ncbi:MAG: hypothetical protein HC820_03965 [Hydrococcus sp. RM1_1_31]|nr:hypothetical protein [Hydrococcus sp. RM1_1_31]
MQYSLLSRFQGGLLGSLLGETLASHALRSEKITVLDLKLSPWSEIGIELSDRLLEVGQLSTSDWEQIYQRYQNCLGAKITPHSDEIALAVLPLLFFFMKHLAYFKSSCSLCAMFGNCQKRYEKI